MVLSKASALSDQSDAEDIPVLLEDQQRISNFSRLDFKRKDRLAEAAALKESLRRLRDATEETTLCMDPNGLLLKVGESFVSGLDEIEIMNQIERQQKKIIEKLQIIEDEIHNVTSEMEELKTTLYAKFGSERINLEFE